jgi:hypothetical protein
MTSELRILEQGIETVIIKARDDYSLGGFVFHYLHRGENRFWVELPT